MEYFYPVSRLNSLCDTFQCPVKYFYIGVFLSSQQVEFFV